VSYIFGGNTGLSYGQAQQRRPRRQQAQPESPYAAVLDALDGWGEPEETAEPTELGSLLKGLFKGGETPPVSPAPFSAQETARAQTGTNIGTMSDTDWLRYSNSGKIRNKPLSDELVGALSYLPGMGIDVEVFSGGQTSSRDPSLKGVAGGWTGSTRHNDGGAADVFFYKDGRKLDWANLSDLPLFEEIVRQARANGLTGIGAGPGYMQPGSMHIGFGAPAVWGAGGRGVNAPDWLRRAYYGG